MSYEGSGLIHYNILGKLLGANMNSTADQSIPIRSANYIIKEIVIANASTSLSLAAGGFYTAPSKGGSAIVAAIQTYSALTGSTLILNPTLALGTTKRTESPLYFALTTAQGGAATADIYIFGYALDS